VTPAVGQHGQDLPSANNTQHGPEGEHDVPAGLAAPQGEQLFGGEVEREREAEVEDPLGGFERVARGQRARSTKRGEVEHGPKLARPLVPRGLEVGDGGGRRRQPGGEGVHASTLALGRPGAHRLINRRSTGGCPASQTFQK
jgi:hypothetical protein